MGDDNTITRQDAEALGRRMQGLAAHQTEVVYDFLSALGEFDARQAAAHFQGIKSSAHFVAWACSMSAGTAREHVRVARALRDLPRVGELMRQGRLSYSKVRELTRVTQHLGEDALCELALEMTASQVARTVAAYRTAAGTPVRNLAKRRFTLTDSPDGMVRITIVLPPEEAALVAAAVEAAARRTQRPPTAALPAAGDQDAAPPAAGEQDAALMLEGAPAGTCARSLAAPNQQQVGGVETPKATSAAAAAAGDAASVGDANPSQPALEGVPAGTPTRSLTPPDRVQAILDVAACYLDTLPDEPADDHTLVLVHVNAAQLVDATPHATDHHYHHHLDPDAEPAVADSASPTNPTDSANPTSPAPRTTPLDGLVCHVEGQGPIEAATAQRLACTSTLLGVILGANGDVLRLGRTRRLASRAQRRALKIRDKCLCQFPGCHQTTHLDAHHLTPWSAGGTTDLDAMILLCRRHHVHVHEGGVRLTRDPTSWQRFHFALPDGRPITGTWLADTNPEDLERLLAETPTIQPDPTRIFPAHAGAGFDLHECVRVLFDIQRSDLATAV